MNNRICLVTGASSGIGKAAAKGLARIGASVVMVCRNHIRGEAALSEIQKETGNSSVDLLVTDLSSQEAICQLAEEFKDRYQYLHVLVNNAGVYYSKRHVTIDGIEEMFAVNYLARFLLTNLLLDVLRNSAPARIISVAGAYHTRGIINFEDLQGEKEFNGPRANYQSKLADVLLTYEFARRLEGNGVTANCLHPGVVGTDLVDKDPDFPSFIKFIYKRTKFLMKSPEKGAETILYLAASPEVEEITGQYFINKKVSQSSPESHDESLAKRLWDVSAEITGLH